MTTNTTLIEKREELKRRLVAGEYRTLVDVILDGTARIIQKIIRSPQPLSPWYSSIALYIILLLSGFGGLLLMGEVSAFTEQFLRLSANFLPLSLSIGYFNVASLVAGNIYIHRVFTTFHDSVLDTIQSVANVNDFERWLTATCNWKKHFIFSLLGGIVVGTYLISVLIDTGINILVSTIIGTILINMFSVAFLYFLIYMVVLSAQLGHYHLRLYTAHPASSGVIGNLADLLSNFVYLVALYATLLTLGVALQRFLIPFGVAVIWLFWIPIIGMFILNQNSLSKIIRRAKWKVLSEIQTKVEKLQAVENFENKETMDAINRLMDYHDRVNTTRNSALDFRAYLSFINSLLLPLIAFVLGNLDLVLKLFNITP
jgi:hypothetical protein